MIRDVNPTLRLFFYLGAIALSVSAIVALIVGNWIAARPSAQEPPLRLRWIAFAKTNIDQGSVVKADQLQWQLSRLPEGLPYVLSPQFAVGRYALRNISEGSWLNRDDFIVSAPDDAPVGGAVIPVEVKTEHISGLRTGVRLAFVQDKQVLPEVKNQGVKTSDRGFLLIAIGTSARDHSITILTVKVEADAVDSIKLLGTGQWRPVVLKGHAQ